MNRTHEKHLRRMTGISDPKGVISDEANKRIELAEERLTRLFGRFMEMPFETIVSLMYDLPDEKVIIVPKPEEPKRKTPEEFVKTMTKGAIIVELERRGVETSGKENVEELRELLLETVNEKKPVTAGETE